MCAHRRQQIDQILKLLIAEYGDRKWRANESPIAVLIRTILSQNTSDRNSDRAFESLVSSFGDWDRVADAGVNEIASTIRAGGLAEVKAKYIKGVLAEIRRDVGGLNLDFLRQMSIEEARDWLRHLPGVGMKTASCVLIFSLGMPALPVDTHVFRVTKRLGLVESSASVEKAHKQLENVVPLEDVYRFHVLLIEHGRKVCKAQRPQCNRCVLGSVCPSFAKFSNMA